MTSVDNLDTVLTQLGDFGKYQSLIFSLVCIAVVMHSAVHVAYVFTAKDLDYRCKVSPCDDENPSYDPSWIDGPAAFPYRDNKPEKCEVYLHNQSYTECTPSAFNQEKIESCNSYVFKTDEYTILQEYDLYCSENIWKLTMPGTINTIGQFFGLFASGLASDKFGRKKTLIIGMLLCGACGLIKAWSPTLEWFLFFEFLDAFFGCGTYACGFIMGVELVGPKRRVLAGTISSSCFALGEVLAGAVGWIFRSWRMVIYVLYGPPLLLVFLFWILPESVRWNISKGRIEEAKNTLRKVAKFNGKHLSEDLLDKVVPMAGSLPEESTNQIGLLDIMKSTTLLLRFINCCFCWITCAFLFYGLSLNSVALAGNPYLDFILTSLVEIPGYFICTFILDKFGRRMSLSGSFMLTGVSCLAFIFIPEDYETVKLAVYLIGKFASTAAFTVIYVITSELFPTALRHSLMGACSTVGRIGSMTSPQTPLLSHIWKPLPLLMFSSMAVVAGLLTLLFPETLNIQLPDTIEEAEQIGKQRKGITKPELKY